MAIELPDFYSRAINNFLNKRNQRMKENLQESNPANTERPMAWEEERAYAAAISEEARKAASMPDPSPTVVNNSWTGTLPTTSGGGSYTAPDTTNWVTAEWPQRERVQENKQPLPMTDQSEIRLREKSIEYTVKMFGESDVPLEEFCNVLEGVHNFIRYGIPLKVKHQQTINE